MPYWSVSMSSCFTPIVSSHSLFGMVNWLAQRLLSIPETLSRGAYSAGIGSRKCFCDGQTGQWHLLGDCNRRQVDPRYQIFCAKILNNCHNYDKGSLY
jgi:hypothetical protein